jgi:hypothetical protein
VEGREDSDGGSVNSADRFGGVLGQVAFYYGLQLIYCISLNSFNRPLLLPYHSSPSGLGGGRPPEKAAELEEEGEEEGVTNLENTENTPVITPGPRASRPRACGLSLAAMLEQGEQGEGEGEAIPLEEIRSFLQSKEETALRRQELRSVPFTLWLCGQNNYFKLIIYSIF